MHYMLKFLFVIYRSVITLLDVENEVLTIDTDTFASAFGEIPALPFKLEAQITQGNIVSKQWIVLV
jgi:hypothetical protein